MPEEFSQVNYSLSPEGRADKVITDLSYHFKNENAGEFLLPNTTLWLHREIAEQIRYALEMQQNSSTEQSDE